MQDLLNGGVTEIADPALIAIRPRVPRASALRPGMVLRSWIGGRGRWYIAALEDKPRLAAAVELVLRNEEGIESAYANPLTGQILIHCGPDLPPERIEVLIQRALEFGPMSREEFSALRSKPAKSSFFKHAVAAEIGCSALHLALFGFCPITLAAAGVLLLVHRHQ